MFYDRISVSRYMEQIGRIVMRGPNELMIEKTQHISPHVPTFEATNSRSLRELQSANATSGSLAQRFAEEQYGLLNPILDGQRSGFSYRVFPESWAQRGGVGQCLAVLMLCLFG